jgi:hypothetical protein
MLLQLKEYTICTFYIYGHSQITSKVGHTHKKSKKGGEEEEQLSNQPRRLVFLLKHLASFQQISFQVQATF